MRVSSGSRVCAFVGVWLFASVTAWAQQAPTRGQVLDAMKRATTFMVEKVSTEGGYVWNYLPDLSRRWGEMEARRTMIWIQPPGTPSMGHLFLDAYHATGDEYYYQAAEKAAGALIRAQHASGGWHYMADFAGERSMREWYDTIGKNAWRLEEFQHNWGNATFDDGGTAEASKLMLRLYLQKRDPKYKAALDKAIRFVLDSQYPVGAWPQRFPIQHDFANKGRPDYTSYLTFNDDVASGNIEFLVLCYQALGDTRLLEPITRGMNAFVVTQQPRPQAGWALQYTTDLKPAGARTYEPRALVTHTTASNLQALIKFYRWTGDAKYLARIPEALDWLDGVTLPPGTAAPGRTHPTFVEVGTNKPLYVHREGSNVVNGRYYVDYNPKNTIQHYSSFRAVDVAGLRKLYAEAKLWSPAELAKTSPLSAGVKPLPRFFAAERPTSAAPASVIAALNAEGYWLSPLGSNSHVYHGDGSKTPAPGDFSRTAVGDDSDTSPFPDPSLVGISAGAYIRNMSALIRALESPASVAAPAATLWPVNSLKRIGGHPVTVLGSPRVVETSAGEAVEFDGADDGLILEVNPLAGLERFTVEIVFEPAADGAEEQRFLHFEEAVTGNRALVELRLLPGASWCLDTFLRHGEASLTLIDRAVLHPAGRWHAAALSFDGKVMTHYVDGVRELSGEVAFKPLGPGQTSIGVRLNKRSWFKGRIRTIRITAAALPPADLLKADARSR
jgi:PelA/Pel-15E family pectate lyase